MVVDKSSSEEALEEGGDQPNPPQPVASSSQVPIEDLTPLGQIARYPPPDPPPDPVQPVDLGNNDQDQNQDPDPDNDPDDPDDDPMANQGQAAPVAPPTKSFVAKPEIFDGKMENFEKFKRQFHLYLMGNTRLFDEDDKKIMFVLSYMTEGLADQWAQNVMDEALANNDTLPTWNAFVQSLEQTFSDTNKTKNAQNKQ